MMRARKLTAFWTAALLLLGLVWLATPALAAPQPKVEICHIPPGNPDNFHTITIGEKAFAAHLAHGDLGGACDAACAALCDDGDACTIDDTGDCEQNGCPTTRDPVDCDDQNQCTEDSCNSASGCVNTPRTGESCDDDVICTGADTCDDQGVCAGAPIENCCVTDSACSQNLCDQASCDQDTNRCVEDPVECTAPDLCTISVCASDTGECVDNSVVCEEGQSCDPGSGQCVDDACPAPVGPVSTIYVDASASGAQDGSVSDPFVTIQEGVDLASPGDTILVAAGTYEESVVITTDAITLNGEAGAILDGTNVVGNNVVGNAIYLTSVSCVTVQGFDIRHYNAGGLHGGSTGIYLLVASNNVIKDNTISDTHDAIVLWFRDNSGNTIEGNEISASTIGINLLYDNDDNVIRNNTTTNTNGNGIILTGRAGFGAPNGNTVSDNVISTNRGGIGLHVGGPGASDNVFTRNDISGVFSDGIALFSSTNTAEHNMISGGARAIHISANSTTVRGNMIDGSGLRGIHLQGNFNVVENNDISAGRTTGIFLFYQDNNLVESNTISGAGSGILVQGLSGDRKPNDNEIRLNQVLDSGQYGIRLLGGASRNLIKENTVSGSIIKDLFHDLASTPNTWTDNTCDPNSESGADIPPC